MQLYALDSKENLIQARKAEKQKDYFCLECGDCVRVRGGFHRQKHFFHSQPTTYCKQNGKSMQHLQVQCFVQQIFPNGEIVLEQRFPTINRIADAVWASEKIIFEVQCSPISAEEIRERNRNYSSLGYKVVWILHDLYYNRKRLNGAELHLISHPHYFTNINKEGKGIIYDQFNIPFAGLRKKFFEKLRIDLTTLLKHEKIDRLPLQLQKRLQTWDFHFEGDLLDICKRDANFVDKLLQFEAENTPQRAKTSLERWAIPYKMVLRFFLEKACK